MLLRLLSLLTACAVGTLRVAAQDNAPGDRVTFRATSDALAVYATVRNQEGRLVANLTRENFQVLEGSTPSPISVFSIERSPLSVAVLLSSSAGKVGAVPIVGRSFVDALGPEDRAVIGTFGTAIAMNPNFTADKQVLRRVVDEELFPEHGHRLGNAISEAMTALGAAGGRRAIVVVANGRSMRAACLDGTPCVSIDTARERVVNEGVVVYGFDLELDRGYEGIRPFDRSLWSLSDATGGGYVRLESGIDLTDLMEEVVEELRSQYLLGITPANQDGGVHSITVRTNRPGLTVRARPAPAPPAP